MSRKEFRHFVVHLKSGEEFVIVPKTNNTNKFEVWFPTKKVAKRFAAIKDAQTLKKVMFYGIKASDVFAVIAAEGGLNEDKHPEGQLPERCLSCDMTDIELVARGYDFALSLASA